MNHLELLNNAWEENHTLAISCDQLKKKLLELEKKEERSLVEIKRLEDRIARSMEALSESEKELFSSKKKVLQSLIQKKIQRIEMKGLEEKLAQEKRISSLYKDLFILKKEWDDKKAELISFQNRWALKELAVMITPPYWFIARDEGLYCSACPSGIDSSGNQFFTYRDHLEEVFFNLLPILKYPIANYDLLGARKNIDQQKEILSEISSLVEKISFCQERLKSFDPDFTPMVLPTLAKRKTLLTDVYGRSDDSSDKPLSDFFSTILRPLLPPP